jgi:hypothetical protein
LRIKIPDSQALQSRNPPIKKVHAKKLLNIHELSRTTFVYQPMMLDYIRSATEVAPVAYLDGGSGSLLFQMLIAGSLTAIYAIKTQWQNLNAQLHKLRNRTPKTSDV